jgi:hypothetical protein
MTATWIESEHFLTHCEVAALVIDTLPANAATRAHARHALRMATLNVAGRNGVLYASSKARQIKQATGKDWHQSGLIKEHVVPLSLIHKWVVEELARPLPADGAAGVTTTIVRADRARQVANIVREWTLLAWISQDDDARLRDRGLNAGKSLHKSMPADWDGQDRFARYSACGIEYAPI